MGLATPLRHAEEEEGASRHSVGRLVPCCERERERNRGVNLKRTRTDVYGGQQ